MLKRILSFTIVLLTMHLHVQAALIAFDNFDFGETRDDLTSFGSSGDGWSGGWAGADGPDYTPLINLTYTATGYNNDDNDNTTGSMVRGGGSAGTVATRDLTSTQTGTVWVSALINVGDRALFWLRGDNETNNFIGINGNAAEMRFGGSDISLSDSGYTTGQTHLLLAKLEFDASGNDNISFWVNPNLSTGESGLGTANTASANIGIGLTGIGVSAQSGSDYLDALRVGTTFDSVTIIPEPSTYAAIFGILVIGIVLVRRRFSARTK